MKDHPIIFNSEMVKAILEKRKTQTRRVIKPQPGTVLSQIENSDLWTYTLCDREWRCPFGKIGDRLWVRENFAPLSTAPTGAYYRADYDEADVKKAIKKGGSSGWKPSIYMPRLASRITLEITNIRVERLQEITVEGCEKEGLKLLQGGILSEFMLLWNSIHKKDNIWEDNPYVWVIEFKIMEGV